MNNLFQTDLHIQRKYDLKGSTQGRFSGKLPSPNTILKDLDLDIRLKLEEGWHERSAAATPVSYVAQAAMLCVPCCVQSQVESLRHVLCLPHLLLCVTPNYRC